MKNKKQLNNSDNVDLITNNLKKYIEYFKSIYNNEKSNNERQERQERVEFYKKFNKQKIEEMSDEEMAKFIGKLWAGNRFTLKNINLANLKTQLIDFLFGTEDLKIRWDKFKIIGLGNGRKSELLCYYFPTNYAILNKITIETFNILGLNLGINGKFSGEQYVQYCDLNKKIQSALQSEKLNCENLLAVDYYLWELYEKEKYNKQNILQNKKIGSEKQDLSEDLLNCSPNTIFYGVPGCGKSFYIKLLLKNLESKYYKRILFHPEYTYSDFIGQVLPVVEGSSITYSFQAGPFVEILKDAISDKDNNYYLVIEEINRGNAPAIFGDVFQLLDRNDNNESEYGIYNKDILSKLDANLQEIKIPKNLFILATMNTSDQNVFTLDTAFKRRWRMCRIKNEFDKINDMIISCGQENNEIKYNWKDFAKRLNEDILKNCDDGTIAEDKQLGAYFIKNKEIEKNVFAEKIFMYLWCDVVKYNKEQLFNISKYNTLDKVIEGFVKGENVFSDNCTNLNEYYKEITSKVEVKNEE